MSEAPKKKPNWLLELAAMTVFAPVLLFAGKTQKTKMWASGVMGTVGGVTLEHYLHPFEHIKDLYQYLTQS